MIIYDELILLLGNQNRHRFLRGRGTGRHFVDIGHLRLRRDIQAHQISNYHRCKGEDHLLGVSHLGNTYAFHLG